MVLVGAATETVCGFALGNPMNIATVIATYAAITKEFGLPLRFPGKPGAYRAIYQATDADLLARAMVFCATDARAANDVFNITNGDFFRWRPAPCSPCAPKTVDAPPFPATMPPMLTM